MRTPVFVVLATLIAIFGIAADAIAQGPSGTVTLSGPGAALLPSSTFVPATYEGTPGTWSFFDVSSAIGVLVVEDEADPTKATFLSVAEDGGETWIATSIFGPISGVEIGSDTISFANVMVPQSGTTTPEHLVLDGSLTRGTQVDVESAGVRSIKSQYSSAQR